ncbi:MAG: NfeD family protein, partial [Verrucomicrobiota bacterium]
SFAPRGYKSFAMAMPVWLKEKLFQKSLLNTELKKHVPGFNRLVLNEAIAEGPALGGNDVSVVAGGGEAESRVGETGMTTTDLRPAGKGLFGDDYLDVVSEGDFIEKDVPVRIVAHEGSRIVVVEIPG